MSRRKRFSEMTVAELEEYERASNYLIGRSDAFAGGNPETILEYWDRNAPDYNELLVIVRTILERST